MIEPGLKHFSGSNEATKTFNREQMEENSGRAAE